MNASWLFLCPAFMSVSIFIDEFVCKTILEDNGTYAAINDINRIKNCFHVRFKNLWIHRGCKIFVVDIFPVF